MAPVSEKPSHLIVERVRIAGVEVKALIDTGATTSCCRWGWYKRWNSHLGPLMKSGTTVTGIGGSPLSLKGITKPVKLEWDGVEDSCELMVCTLRDVDVILGMDVLGKLEVQIDAREGKARPKQTSQVYNHVDERISYIGYVKEFYGRHPDVNSSDRGHILSDRKGRLRLSCGNTCKERKRSRCLVSSTKEIMKKGRFHSGLVHVTLLGSEEDLPEELRAIVHASGDQGIIEGQSLLDLCGKRSEEEGGDCYATDYDFLALESQEFEEEVEDVEEATLDAATDERSRDYINVIMNINMNEYPS